MLRNLAIGAALAVLPCAAYAQTPASPLADSGDTSWLLASAALVLLMTLPDSAVLRRAGAAKNLLSVLLQIGAVDRDRLAAVDRARLLAGIRRARQRLALAGGR
jgi:Amt family ammonium transporter